MTRDEILNMPAGREMDALIAEKVMGWNILTKPDGYRYWADTDGEFACGVPPEEGYFEDEEDLHLLKWHPSESILWAWDVVEVLRGKFWSTTITQWDHSRKTVVTCEYRSGRGEHKAPLYADADTAPLAICRAALLAVMEVE